MVHGQVSMQKTCIIAENRINSYLVTDCKLQPVQTATCNMNILPRHAVVTKMGGAKSRAYLKVVIMTSSCRPSHDATRCRGDVTPLPSQNRCVRQHYV